MPFIDVRLSERKGSITKTKLFVNDGDLLVSAVKGAIANYVKANNVTGDKTLIATQLVNTFLRIKSVKCNDCDLTEFTDDNNTNATLVQLDSKSTPIFENGIDITLSPEEKSKEIEEPPTKKQKKSMTDVLMKRVTLDTKYLIEEETDIDNPDPNVDVLIKRQLFVILEEMKLGYVDEGQKRELKTNVGHINNALCFTFKHWKVLLRADHPHIPIGMDNIDESQLLAALGKVSKKKNKKK